MMANLFMTFSERFSETYCGSNAVFKNKKETSTALGFTASPSLFYSLYSK